MSDTERLQERVQNLIERGRALLMDPAQAIEQGRAMLQNPTQAIEMAREMTELALDVGRWALSMLPFGARACACDEHADELRPAPPPWAATPEPPPAAAPEPPAPEPPAVAAAPEPVEAAEPTAPAEAAEEAGEDEQPGRDQLYKVLRILHDEAIGEGRYLTAREIAEAASAAGLPILPGNVRKILRTRAARHIEARLRDGESGKVTEFRLGGRGKSWFQKTYPLH
ncbi:MAG TPA: hypothetical protein VGQ83_35620 [Polyangia bacterium]